MYHVRPASTADVPAIQELTNQIWPATYGHILSKEQLNYMIRLLYNTEELTRQINADYHFLIMEDGEKPIGFAAFSTTDEAGVYKLHKIYLHMDYQGKGAGKQLLDTVVRQVKAEDAQILELNVNRYNKARNFYEKHGFTLYDEKDIDIGNGYWMNDYIMRKVL